MMMCPAAHTYQIIISFRTGLRYSIEFSDWKHYQEIRHLYTTRGSSLCFVHHKDNDHAAGLSEVIYTDTIIIAIIIIS